VGLPKGNAMNTPAQQSLLTTMNQVIDAGTAPLQNIETSLHGLVTFAILPLFALANAGVSLEGDVAKALLSTTSLGIIAGLFLGKQVGITLATWLSVKFRLAELPEGVTWSQVYGASVLGGIGFTMSLFVAGLAFSDAEHLEFAKLGILLGSLISALVGVVLLLAFTSKANGTTES
jgi:Na+:H+ antiporter, NhaA family